MTAEAVILMVDRSLNLVHECIYLDLPMCNNSTETLTYCE